MRNVIRLDAGFPRKEKLSRQDRLAWGLDLHVDVASTTGIWTRHHCIKLEKTVGGGKLMTTQSEILVMVLAVGVGLPEIPIAG